MQKNIDLLKQLKSELIHFNIKKEALELYCELEKVSINDVSEQNYEDYQIIYEEIEVIHSMIEQMSVGLRNILYDNGFDISSFEWCISKVEYSDSEFGNYYESICNALGTLSVIVHELLIVYRVLTENKYINDEEEEELYEE